ncbi:MAG: hypothetical protein Q4B57_03650, partial [Eubacteriales bacterium]|nr:hypothetical protein [Eubacteriales bacterium]
MKKRGLAIALSLAMVFSGMNGMVLAEAEEAAVENVAVEENTVEEAEETTDAQNGWGGVPQEIADAEAPEEIFMAEEEPSENMEEIVTADESMDMDALLGEDGEYIFDESAELEVTADDMDSVLNAAQGSSKETAIELTINANQSTSYILNESEECWYKITVTQDGDYVFISP